MRLDDIPLVFDVFDAGPDDRVFDSLLLIGPPVVALIVVLGRSLLTEGLAVAYIAVFVAYVLYQAVRK
ncbi:hypothetical protein [Halolamina salina]|uniref:Uncharacterized protein n=1 Tax=Halolamina salina TaxID=1220023 RepID=A0ABD6B1V7_9EURY